MRVLIISSVIVAIVSGCSAGSFARSASLEGVPARDSKQGFAPARSSEVKGKLDPVSRSVASGAPTAVATQSKNLKTSAILKDDQETEFLRLINGFRRDLQLQELAIDPRLQIAAEKHSEMMNERQYLSHYGPAIGETSGDRMIAEGVPCVLCGENIASGNTGAKRTFLQWVFSTSHLLGMITPSYDHIGISRVGIYWTTDFAVIDESNGFTAPAQPTREAVVHAVESVVGPLGERANDITLDETVPPPAPRAQPAPPTPGTQEPEVENDEEGDSGTQVTQMAKDAINNAKEAVSDWIQGLRF